MHQEISLNTLLFNKLSFSWFDMMTVRRSYSTAARRKCRHHIVNVNRTPLLFNNLSLLFWTAVLRSFSFVRNNFCVVLIPRANRYSQILDHSCRSYTANAATKALTTRLFTSLRDEKNSECTNGVSIFAISFTKSGFCNWNDMSRAILYFELYVANNNMKGRSSLVLSWEFVTALYSNKSELVLSKQHKKDVCARKKIDWKFQISSLEIVYDVTTQHNRAILFIPAKKRKKSPCFCIEESRKEIHSKK